ncbi:hypothetical protein HNY73_016520 [Argiope bruennichi]|uniref:Uncharacterized protein n=1 Tax=Argiope bruennichi TaxID=94029 RepID=A0A8T0EJ20_ARGBR|nr:hypothetical protein HNY73_016520 [Argiope bruennichi]
MHCPRTQPAHRSPHALPTHTASTPLTSCIAHANSQHTAHLMHCPRQQPAHRSPHALPAPTSHHTPHALPTPTASTPLTSCIAHANSPAPIISCITHTNNPTAFPVHLSLSNFLPYSFHYA